jgi:hypothetical protein
MKTYYAYIVERNNKLVLKVYRGKLRDYIKGSKAIQNIDIIPCDILKVWEIVAVDYKNAKIHAKQKLVKAFVNSIS